MGIRRRGRELALQALYQTDLLDQWDHDVLGELRHLFPYETQGFEFANMLFQEVKQRRVHIDRLLEAYADHWTVSRMNVVERNIMRIAACEILFFEDIPRRVSINEAIELAKVYSSKDTGGFLNGILDRIRGRDDDQEGEK